MLRIKRVINEFGVVGIALVDENFFASPNRAYQILEGMVRQRLDIVWNAVPIPLHLMSRLNDDFLKLIETSGCLTVAISVGSGSPRIANMLMHRIDVSQAITLNRRLAKLNLGMRYLFMLGTPGEMPDDLAQTAALILQLLDDYPEASIGLQIYVPYPGTELFDTCIQYGLHEPERLEDWIPYSWSNRRLDFPWWSRDSKSMLRMISFCGYFLETKRSTIYADINPFLNKYLVELPEGCLEGYV